MSAVMGESGPGVPNLAGSLAGLPHNVLVHEILSKISFEDKLRAHQVCKKWAQLLTSGTSTGRHWEVKYTVEWRGSSTGFKSTRTDGLVSEQPNTRIVRCVTVAPLT
jgi:hypothetical protein